MNFSSPPPLKAGDTIGVMAPSSRIDPEFLDQSRIFLEGKGYRVFIHPQCHAALHQSAGTSAQKVAALHDLARNADIRAVFFATGGNRALHILDHIDYPLLAANPKLYMGFSDNTALLNAIAARCGIVTWHGPTFKRIPQNPQIDFNLSLLAGVERTIPLPGARAFREGRAKGMLFGGNLNVFRRLSGSREMPHLKDSILFFEDCNEQTSRLDAELCFLRRSGVFAIASAIILGQFTGLLDTGTPFGFTLEDMIAEHFAGLDVPIIINAPFGHGTDLYAFPVGAHVTLENLALTIHG
jgi:muramoyltetrapeptide carboxypeptidase